MRSRALRRPLLSASLLASVLGTLLAVVLVRGGADDIACGADTCVTAVPWVALGAATAVVVAAAAHYVLAALAMRAAASNQVTLADTTLAQLAATAANRFVPHGVGGAAVNVRFLVRGGHHHGDALAAMGAVGIVGGIAQAAFTAAVLAPGSLLYLPGAAPQLVRLAHAEHRVGGQLPWPVLVAVGAVVLVGLAVRYGRRLVASLRTSAMRAARHLGLLARRPALVGLLFAATAATSIVTLSGFVASVLLVGGGHTQVSIGALVATYFVASGIGGATPLPPFLGATEAALVGGLVVAGLGFLPAVLATVLFRGVSYWLPLPVGVLAARRLRAAGLL